MVKISREQEQKASQISNTGKWQAGSSAKWPCPLNKKTKKFSYIHPKIEISNKNYIFTTKQKPQKKFSEDKNSSTLYKKT